MSIICLTIIEITDSSVSLNYEVNNPPLNFNFAAGIVNPPAQITGIQFNPIMGNPRFSAAIQGGGSVEFFNPPPLFNDMQCYKIVNGTGNEDLLDTIPVVVQTEFTGDQTPEGSITLNNNGDTTWYYNDFNNPEDNFSPNPCCIHPDAKVETPYGLIKIMDIKAGNKVKDINGRFINVAYNIKFMPSDKFVCIKKNALGNNCPFEDLRGTGKHPIFNNGKEILFNDLVNGDTIINEELEDTFVYALCTMERTYVMTSGIPVCTWAQNEWENSEFSKKQTWTKL